MEHNISFSVTDIFQYLLFGYCTLEAIIVIVAISYLIHYYFLRPKPLEPLISLDDQSFVEPGPERIHRSKIYSGGNGEVLAYIDESVRTLHAAFLNGWKISGVAKCLGRRGIDGSFQWQSYHETLQRIKNFGAGLVKSGLPAGQDSVIGIYLKNCPEWIIAEFSAYRYSMIVVALYDTLGDDAVKFIMNQTEVSAILCEDNKAVYILDNITPYLRLIVTIKEVKNVTREKAKKNGVDICTFEEIERRGATESKMAVAPKPEDIATISYTSGTTGTPKGVLLTHANCIASVDACILQLGSDWINKEDVMLSYLPLAHMLERFIQYVFYKQGGAVGFFSGDIKRLNEDLVALKPTFLVSVPRVMNKIYQATLEAVSKSKWKKILFDIAMTAKEMEMRRGIIRKNSIWDALVFRKLQENMGGRLYKMATGSAPMNENVLKFIRCALGCQVSEGYGQTECLLACVILYADTTPGSVGPPVPCCKFKLVDVPEMGYYASDDIGEVCIKGNNVFKGYYKEQKKTNETLDEEGWLHTGDVGRWLPNGTLKILDRKKDIFKLSQGEYIAPEKIESAYLKSCFVEQVFIHGESLKSCIVGIVVPKKEALVERAVRKDIGDTCFDDPMKKVILEEMIQKGKEAGLNSLEQVKDIYLHPEPFSPQNGLLTPTSKMKRREIVIKFKEEIEEMYKKLQ